MISDISDYSSTEKAVGKWINGNTVYEKSFVVDNINLTQQSTGYSSWFNQFIINGTIIEMTGCIYSTTEGTCYPLPFLGRYGSNNVDGIEIQYSTNNGLLVRGWSAFTGYSLYLKLKYFR